MAVGITVSAECRYAKFHNPECRVFIVMLCVIMLSVIMLNVVLLRVVRLIVILLNVVLLSVDYAECH